MYCSYKKISNVEIKNVYQSDYIEVWKKNTVESEINKNSLLMTFIRNRPRLKSYLLLMKIVLKSKFSRLFLRNISDFKKNKRIYKIRIDELLKK